MAELWMDINGASWVALEIAPVRSDHLADAVHYRVATQAHPAAERRVCLFSVEGWQMGPYDLYSVAAAFAQAGSLAGQKMRCSDGPGPRHRPACVYDGATWVRVALWMSSPLGPPGAVVGKVFVQDGPDQDVYRLLHVRVPIMEAEHFGQELIAEIISASPGWAAEYELA